MKVVIGVDGGGTKTLTVCLDENKKEVGKFISACSNKNSVGNELAKTALQAGINGAIVNAGVTINDVAAITIGMSGVDRPADKELVTHWVREIVPENIPFSIHNDATAALASGTEGRLYGIVVISGTGMIAYGYNKNGETARAGGWGPTIGDLGSGHDIGIDVLRAVSRSKDGINPPTLLTEALLTFLGLTKEDELIPWAYNKKDEGWQKIANLGTVAHECAKKGDKKALEIIETAANALFVTIQAVAKRLELPVETKQKEGEEVPLVMAGGNIDRDESPLTDALVRMLRERMPGAIAARPAVNPAIGAAYLAHAAASWN